MNHFESEGGTQNIAQGDGAIGQQNNSNCVSQAVIGNGNVFSGSGDVHIEHLHQHYPRTEQGIPLQRPRLAEHFKGREAVLRDLLPLLQPGKAVTLCGPGGMGKTALAAQAAWTLAPDKEAPARFPDGILFYSFYGRHTAEEALAHVVRSYDEAQQDTSPDAARRLLANKQALLILDGAEEAKDLPAMLKLCGACGVLITSRKNEDAPDELLELKKLEKQPAEEVFRHYSKIAGDDANVQGICKILDGWPVALRIAGRYLRRTKESAADYLKWLEKEPFKELGDGQHQQENAALLLRRSVAQVSDDARLALGLVGTLAFAPIAREPVAAILDGDERRARDALNELVTYGLLERQGERWQISHALVHTYARTELTLSKESLERLALWYIDFCWTQSQAGLEGYARLDGERAHCLRLMESCLDGELWQEVKLLVRTIAHYLRLQGWWTELLAALEMRLNAARQVGDRRDEGWCLNSLGYTCERCREPNKALSWYDQSLPIFRELGERKEEGALLNNMAEIYRQHGKYGLALETYQQSLSIKREIGDRKGEGTTLNNIAIIYMYPREWETALQYCEQCLPIVRELGDKIGEGVTLNNIGEIYRQQGNYATAVYKYTTAVDKYTKAVEHHKQALAIRRELGDRAGEAESCRLLGLTYFNLVESCWYGPTYFNLNLVRLAKAEEYMSQAVQIEEAIGHPDLEEDCKSLAGVRGARHLLLDRRQG